MNAWTWTVLSTPIKGITESTALRTEMYHINIMQWKEALPNKSRQGHTTFAPHRQHMLKERYIMYCGRPNNPWILINMICNRQHKEKIRSTFLYLTRLSLNFGQIGIPKSGSRSVERKKYCTRLIYYFHYTSLMFASHIAETHSHAYDLHGKI